MATDKMIWVEKATADEEREVARSVEKWRTLSGQALESARDRGRLLLHLQQVTRGVWKRTKNTTATWASWAKEHLDCSERYARTLIRIAENWAVIDQELKGEKRNVNRAKMLLAKQFPEHSPKKRAKKRRAVTIDADEFVLALDEHQAVDIKPETVERILNEVKAILLTQGVRINVRPARPDEE